MPVQVTVGLWAAILLWTDLRSLPSRSHPRGIHHRVLGPNQRDGWEYLQQSLLRSRIDQKTMVTAFLVV